MTREQRSRPAGNRAAVTLSDSPILAQAPDKACDHAVCWDCQQAAWDAGVEYGTMRANRLAAQAIAQELLSAQAAEMAGLARREASRVGPAWTALVTGVGE